jgi:dihydrofolate reductase
MVPAASSREEQDMGRIIVVENVSLDGVMQAPGRPDEDRRGGFDRGGWGVPYNDSVKSRVMAAGMAQAGPLLFGRRTYEDFFAVWPKRKDNPFTEVLDAAQKYVASTTLAEPLPWKNSTLLAGDAMDAVTRLKEREDKDIVVLGSGELVRSLMRCSLVDELVLLIHPLVLGSGRRLFADDSGAAAAFRVADAQTTTTGVIVATYQQVQAAGQRSAARRNGAAENIQEIMR